MIPSHDHALREYARCALAAAHTQGHAYLSGPTGGVPPVLDPEMFGWRRSPLGWVPRGKWIGWTDGAAVVFDRPALLAALGDVPACSPLGRSALDEAFAAMARLDGQGVSIGE